MFQPFKQWAEQDTEAYIIANSQTLNVGDAVYFSGAANRPLSAAHQVSEPTGLPMFGVCMNPSIRCR